MTRNLAASVNARLRNLARAQGLDYNRVELLYFQERLLARLAVSGYGHQFILKGGLFLYSRYQTTARPTRDVDVLGWGLPSDVDTLVDTFKAIASHPLEDGLHFDPDTVGGQRIKEGADYEGVRLKIRGQLGQARQVLQIDVGFGDAITPAPRNLDYPTLLADAPFTLLAYSLETVIAEKFQAMVMLYTINTRFKDFYDLYQIARSEVIKAEGLRKALRRTFEQRHTPLGDAKHIFDPYFIEDAGRQRQWMAYVQSLHRELDLPFRDVMETLRCLLEPIIEDKIRGVWQPSTEQWLRVKEDS